MITKPLVIGKCPRCGGQLYIDKDFWGKFMVCIQCGYEKDIEEHKAPKPITNLLAKE
jgi:DNA-directed RNA polymerase subunit M/transcription elongation factor TFIIS